MNTSPRPVFPQPSSYGAMKSINDNLWSYTRTLFILIWQHLKTPTPEYSHTYWAAHFLATRKGGRFCSGQAGRQLQLHQPRGAPAAPPPPVARCSWAFASTVNYSLSVFQTGIDPLISSTLPSPFYGFCPHSARQQQLYHASRCLPTHSSNLLDKVFPTPREIPSPALLSILLLTWFYSSPDFFLIHMLSLWKID